MPGLDAINFGPGGSFRFANNAGRSLYGESIGTIRYPSPFFDISHTYLPTSFKSMLRWCRYYFLTNPLINAVCSKMAEYPVTDLVFDSDNEHENKRWSEFFEGTLHYKAFEVESGLDYNVYGNAFISIHFPFRKLLKCKKCHYSVRVTQQKYTFRDFSFAGECQRCHTYGEFDVRDHYVRSVREIRLIRWNPEFITIEHNEATGENRYYYTIPAALANDIRMAKRHVIENVPQIFIEALRKNKALLFNKQNIYHMQRPTIAQKDRGWGLPMVLPVLKDCFYLQVLRKAQESISVEHIVPLRILFPTSGSSTSDVYSTVNLSQWRDKIENEIIRWRLDNNYIPIMPVPVGQQTLGGDGRALLLSQEYRQWSEHIVVGMGVPVEFVWGGLSFSGSSVSMRMLENHFLGLRSKRKRLVSDFIMPSVGAYMGWSAIPSHYKRFKMADDLQRSAYYLQLAQAGKISDRTMLEDVDWDSTAERDRIEEERKHVIEAQRKQALDQAAIQGEAQLVMAKYQMRGQKLMNELIAEQTGQGMPAQPPLPVQGQPGMLSPEAQGQMMNSQTAMMNQMGQIPPMEIPPSGPVPGTEAGGEMGPAPLPPGMEGVQSQVSSGAGGYGDLMIIANQVVSWLNKLQDQEKQHELVKMQLDNPQLYSLVLPMLQQTAGAERSSAALPQPQQKPPRRGPEAVMS